MKRSAQNVALIVAAVGVVLFYVLIDIDHMDELENFVRNVEALPEVEIQPLPQLSERDGGKAAFVRDPFVLPAEKSSSTREIPVRNWLQNSRVVSVSGQRALVVLGDGAVYTVRRGDTLMDGRMTVTAISADSVEVRYTDGRSNPDQVLQRYTIR